MDFDNEYADYEGGYSKKSSYDTMINMDTDNWKNNNFYNFNISKQINCT